MRDTAFLVSQPLQVLVALSIIEQLGLQGTSHILLVGTFFNAKKIYERMKWANEPFSDIPVEYFENHKEAYRFAGQKKFKKFYTEGDVGAKNFLNLLFLKVRSPSVGINVYEEGVGTYRSDLYSGFKKKFFKLLGIGTNFGGCALTKHIYVFNPDEYLKIFPENEKKIKKIEKTPVDVINSHFDSLGYIFDRSPIDAESGELCNIYLSNRNVDTVFLERFSALKGDKYIKLHPRCQMIPKEKHGILLSRTAPAEMALLDLKQRYKVVNIYHHGSSVERYFHDKNVNFLKI